jgi:hypothetical protein
MSENGWQPIETAPKHRHHHLMMWGSGIGFYRCTFIGVWVGDRWQEAYGNRDADPTHWAPTPEPPDNAEIVGKNP